MYCPKCGQINSDRSSACSKCSERLPPDAFQGQAVPKVPNYLPTSILVTLCCCLPAGIPAIVYQIQSNTALESGDYLGAIGKAKTAYTWCWVAFGLGFAVILLQILAGALGG